MMKPKPPADTPLPQWDGYRPTSSSGVWDASPLSPQQAGLHLLETVYQLSDALQEHDEEVMELAFQTLVIHLNVMFEAEAQLVLFGHAGIFFLNRTPLRMTFGQRRIMAACWERLEAKQLGGFMVMGPSEEEEVEDFFRRLLAPDEVPTPTKTLYPLSLENAMARIASLEKEQVGQGQLLLDNAPDLALSLYAQLLQWVRQRYNPLKERPPKRDADRILKKLCQLCEGRAVRFLGFRETQSGASYQSYHIANTAILAMLFGGALGFNRRQQLELAWVTLEHELGKLDLPAELLQKSGPLSEQERHTIEMLPVRTVWRLLEQRFNWSRLKYALITLDVRLRPSTTQSPEGSLQEVLAADPTLLFSRIIGLCVCFDALCSERPFRAAMSPDEALSFMRGPLAKQFDPVLLTRFVSFLLPGVLEGEVSTKQLAEAPAEQRPTRETNTLPLLQTVQQQLSDYYAFKSSLPSAASEEQQAELATLRSSLLEALRLASL